MPNRIRKHATIKKHDCDVLVGICFQPNGEPSYNLNKKGGRWNWAAVNLETGMGCMYYSSQSVGSGHLNEFNISQEGLAEAARIAAIEKKHRQEEREEQKGLKSGKLCIVHGFGYYGCGYLPHVRPIEEAQGLAADDPGHYRLYRAADTGFWHLERELRELPKEEWYKPPAV